MFPPALRYKWFAMYRGGCRHGGRPYNVSTGVAMNNRKCRSRSDDVFYCPYGYTYPEQTTITENFKNIFYVGKTFSRIYISFLLLIMYFNFYFMKNYAIIYAAGVWHFVFGNHGRTLANNEIWRLI